MRFDRRRRILAPEKMDAEPAPAADLARCLGDLEWLSRLTLGYRPTLAYLDRALAAAPPGAELSILDVACGGGDMLRVLRRWGERRGVRLRLAGIDHDPRIVAAARARTPQAACIDYVVGDVFAAGLRADYVISALFAHHLDDDRAARLIAWMRARARRGWLLSDLHRHAVPYWFLRVVPPLLRLHRFVRHDAPVSVARGWRGAELLALADAAGVPAEAVRLRWHAPFRWTLEGRAAEGGGA